MANDDEFSQWSFWIGAARPSGPETSRTVDGASSAAWVHGQYWKPNRKSTFEKTSMDWFKRKPIHKTHKTHKTIVVVCKHAGWSCYFFPYTSSGNVRNGHPNNPRFALCTLWWAATSHCHQKSLKQLGSWLVDFETQRLQYLDKLCVLGWQKVIETYLSEGHS